MNLNHVAQEVVRPLASIFLPAANEQRPTYGDARKFQEDSHWPDCILFCEYFPFFAMRVVFAGSTTSGDPNVFLITSNGINTVIRHSAV